MRGGRRGPEGGGVGVGASGVCRAATEALERRGEPRPARAGGPLARAEELPLRCEPLPVIHRGPPHVRESCTHVQYSLSLSLYSLLSLQSARLAGKDVALICSILISLFQQPVCCLGAARGCPGSK